MPKYIEKTKQIDGVRYRAFGRTAREAQRKLDDIIYEVRRNGQRLDGSTTVRKWSEEWLQVYIDPKDITQKSIDMYRQKLNKHILPQIGAMQLKDVRDTHLQKLLNKANTSKSTAQKVKIVLQKMFHQAYKSRLIPYDPSEDLILPRSPEGKGRSITDHERKNILEVAEYHRAGLYVLMIYYCGLRPGECIALKWKDVDLKKRLIHVRTAAESGNSANLKDPKTRSGIRDVPIPDKLFEKLHKPKGADFQPVFLQPNGQKQHTESSLNDAWNNFKRELDIHMGAKVYRNKIVEHCYEVDPMKESEADWNTLVPYCLRHTYGTDCQRAGVPINVIKYLMGHSDIGVTSKYYIDTTPDVIEGALDALNNLHLPKKCTTDEKREPVTA